MPELTAEERTAVRGRLADLLAAASEQTARVRALVAHTDAVGIERADWPVLVEIAARTEMLRRLHQEIAEGRVLLGETGTTH